MKRSVLIICMVASLTLLAQGSAVAAPCVSLNAGMGPGLAGIQVGFPLSEHVSLLVHASWAPIDWEGSIFGSLAGDVGLRYYFGSPGQSRFFATAYGGAFCFIDPFLGPIAAVFGTVGYEFVIPAGGPLRVSLEAGGGCAANPFDWEFLPLPAVGLTVGYQF